MIFAMLPAFMAGGDKIALGSRKKAVAGSAGAFRKSLADQGAERHARRPRTMYGEP